MSSYYIGELVSLLFMAFALGLDAFSVSLGLGMQQLRLKRIAFVGLIIGLFHIIMPFSGIILGQAISTQIGNLTTLAGGLLLFGIGAQMLFSAFHHEAKKIIQPVGIGLLFLAFSVSIDSFSVGLSLGISGVKTALAFVFFGIASTTLSWAGMMLGRKVHGILGVYSEILGGSILCGFGLLLLFG
ncbi:manganese efflux pump [Virgibacillus sp. NKC19-3]|uniref:manganese efflux pump MntP n=1 Tax=Virgibacillus saliphilus TaxID=2831674 RepID=UPI001C9AD827|nr:manganese efflux pump [Virgibacillus sp. NKC19-3]MBY7144737.1 manganese efflux pump [Virgibacillus sp. NKC19-3]